MERLQQRWPAAAAAEAAKCKEFVLPLCPAVTCPVALSDALTILISCSPHNYRKEKKGVLKKKKKKLGLFLQKM